MIARFSAWGVDLSDIPRVLQRTQFERVAMVPPSTVVAIAGKIDRLVWARSQLKPICKSST
ncbi:hypothetical protein SUH3_07570 [Pseudosulfitobacter pseudonitzschiae]|uniref:Uncharacterized protein n=1 Tax=Pseudosulfitobacter pseudonitzschiae TaxID=1402135 RepID=A0A073IXN2_9RHOB|nr:hypothetical protein SUH3_07570 [Pseudosulfitobacter pseudonitzschiae]